MRYIEYAYLVVAVALGIYLATQYRHLTTGQMIAMGAGAAIASFMYSFRRQQRLIAERQLRKFEEEEKEAQETNQDLDD